MPSEKITVLHGLNSWKEFENPFVAMPKEERAPYLAERRVEIIEKLDKDRKINARLGEINKLCKPHVKHLHPK